jgi:glycosyltransferase involved in cell wall biosynthesis
MTLGRSERVTTLKITFISPALNMSGGVKVICIYAEQLARLGHLVTIVSQPQNKPSLRERVRSIKKGNGWISQPSMAAPKGVQHLIVGSARPVVDTDVPDADVVVATWWETAEWVSSFSASKGRKFYFVQGHEIYKPIPERSRDTYALPLKKIVVSKWLKDIMESGYGDSNVLLVPNSVDRFKFYAPPREKQKRPTVGLLYSTESPKGLDTSLRAVEIVKEKIPRVKVVSFGSQPKARSHPLPSGSSFYRSPNADRIREIYSRCDVWLTSSRSEGFNLTALEAMACRTPVVATKTGWPADGIINGVNGILCDVDDANGLADGLEQILSGADESWEKMSEYAYQTMTTSSWMESAKLFERHLQ